MPTWSADLPQYFLREGSGGAMRDGRIAFQPDRGPAIERLGNSSTPEPLYGRMVFTPEQYDAFEEFVTDDLGGGIIPFDFPHPLTREMVKVKFGEALPSWESYDGLNVVGTLQLQRL